MDMRALFIQQARHPTGPAVGIKRPRRPFSSAPPIPKNKKPVNSWFTGSRPLRGLVLVENTRFYLVFLTFFCSLNISILYLYFCPDCAIFVPNLSREIILIFRYYLKKSGKIYYPTSAHPAGPTSWTMPFFSSKRSMVRCCSAIVSCCEQTVSINIDILSNTSLGKLMFSGFCSPSIFIPSLMSISCKVFASKTGRFSHCPIV